MRFLICHMQNANSAMQKKQQQQQQQQLHYNDLQVKVFFGTILTSFQIFFQIIEMRSAATLLEERKNTEAAKKNLTLLVICSRKIKSKYRRAFFIDLRNSVNIK